MEVITAKKLFSKVKPKQRLQNVKVFAIFQVTEASISCDKLLCMINKFFTILSFLVDHTLVPEAAILLVCARKPPSISEHAQGTRTVVFSQSDLSYMTRNPLVTVKISVGEDLL